MRPPKKPRKLRKSDFTPQKFWINKPIDESQPYFRLTADNALLEELKMPAVNLWGLNPDKITGIYRHTNYLEFDGHLEGQEYQEIIQLLLDVRKNLNAVPRGPQSNSSRDFDWNFEVNNWKNLPSFEVQSSKLDELIEKTKAKLANITSELSWDPS